MPMYLENYILDVIEGRRSAPFTKKMLRFFSSLFRCSIALRHLAYDKKWIKSFSVPIPVVSVGNIVSGGVGKTPLVKKLAEELSKKRKIAILTRGFRSKIEKSGKHLKWKGEKASLCGDEPFWLAKKLPHVAIWIGKKRKKTAALAFADGAELLLLDDGMQHRKLERDTEIIVMDVKDLWGKGYFLPRGYLRDLPSRLKHARIIVLMQVKEKVDVEKVRFSLERVTKAPLVGMHLKVNADLQGKKVGVFCAIARPERFLETVQNLGAIITGDLRELDHRSFQPAALTRFAELCLKEGAEALVCTEKDSVKLPEDLRLCLPVIPIQADLEIITGQNHWNDLIEELSNDRRI